MNQPVIILLLFDWLNFSTVPGRGLWLIPEDGKGETEKINVAQKSRLSALLPPSCKQAGQRSRVNQILPFYIWIKTC